MERALEKFFYILVHMVWFELPVVLILTSLASWRLSIVLGKHDARSKEAKLARNVAAFYVALTVVLGLASQILS